MTPPKDKLLELAKLCESEAIEQVEMAMAPETDRELADQYLRLATNLFACTDALRSRSQTIGEG